MFFWCVQCHDKTPDGRLSPSPAKDCKAKLCTNCYERGYRLEKIWAVTLPKRKLNANL